MISYSVFYTALCSNVEHVGVFEASLDFYNHYQEGAQSIKTEIKICVSCNETSPRHIQKSRSQSFFNGFYKYCKGKN